MSNMIEVFQYEHQDVRVIEKDGEPWFVARDVSGILGYSEASAMTRTLDDDEKGVTIVRTNGGPQEVGIVSEAGLYSLILGSRKPSARQFKRWVTHSLLPSIRRGQQMGHDDESVIDYMEPDEMHLYVVEILGVGAKVGITKNPASRIAQHRRDAEAYGRSVGRVWISEKHGNARENERILMDGSRREYLNVGYDDCVAWAESLPKVPGVANPDFATPILKSLTGINGGNAIATLERHYSRGAVALALFASSEVLAGEVVTITRNYGETFVLNADKEDA